nr:reverse transcriptase domain-containing protein [Tanacetum cinerariifolium]
MQTRSYSKFVSEPSTNLISTNSKRRNQRRLKPRVEPFSIVEIPIVTMADNRTMEEMLQAPTEGEPSTNLISTNSKRRNQRRLKPRVEPFSIVEIPIVTMADNRTMEEMLQAPTEGYGDAIVVPDILAENFEIRIALLSLIKANQFHGFESNNLHNHIRSFNRITLTLKFRDVPNDAIKLMLFPYSLKRAAKIWYEKEPPWSILT